MIQRKQPSPLQEAITLAILLNAKIEELGVKATVRRIRIVPLRNDGRYCIGNSQGKGRFVMRKRSAIEIARRAQQRAADRFARDMEGVYH